MSNMWKWSLMVVVSMAVVGCGSDGDNTPSPLPCDNLQADPNNCIESDATETPSDSVVEGPGCDNFIVIEGEWFHTNTDEPLYVELTPTINGVCEVKFSGQGCWLCSSFTGENLPLSVKENDDESMVLLQDEILIQRTLSDGELSGEAHFTR